MNKNNAAGNRKRLDTADLTWTALHAKRDKHHF